MHQCDKLGTSRVIAATHSVEAMFSAFFSVGSGFQQTTGRRRQSGETGGVEYGQQTFFAIPQLSFLLHSFRGKIRGTVEIQTLLQKIVVFIQRGQSHTNRIGTSRKLIQFRWYSAHLHLQKTGAAFCFSEAVR